MYVAMVVGTAVALLLEKYFYIGLLLYVPLYLHNRQFNPKIPKSITEAFRQTHLK